MLHFKDEIGIIKCFANELEAHGLDAGEHNLFYQGATALLSPASQQRAVFRAQAGDFRRSAFHEAQYRAAVVWLRRLKGKK